VSPLQASSGFTPPLAGIVFERSFEVDDLLAQAVRIIRSRKAKVVGILQENVLDGSNERTLQLRSLAGEWAIPVLEKRGLAARGCRLDYNAIAEVSVRLEAILAQPADLLVMNRFGRAESEGGGLRQIYERAAMEALPVLTAIRSEYLNAWQSYHGGLGIELPPDLSSIMDWWSSVSGGALLPSVPSGLPEHYG
jgi:hypothetical protein